MYTMYYQCGMYSAVAAGNCNSRIINTGLQETERCQVGQCSPETEGIALGRVHLKPGDTHRHSRVCYSCALVPPPTVLAGSAVLVPPESPLPADRQLPTWCPQCRVGGPPCPWLLSGFSRTSQLTSWPWLQPAPTAHTASPCGLPHGWANEKEKNCQHTRSARQPNNAFGKHTVPA